MTISQRQTAEAKEGEAEGDDPEDDEQNKDGEEEPEHCGNFQVVLNGTLGDLQECRGCAAGAPSPTLLDRLDVSSTNHDRISDTIMPAFCPYDPASISDGLSPVRVMENRADEGLAGAFAEPERRPERGV